MQIHLFDVKLKGDEAETAGPNGPSTTPANQPEKKTGESLRIRPGKKICEPVETVAGKVGLEICYDIRSVSPFPSFPPPSSSASGTWLNRTSSKNRFPEIHAILRDKGAQIIALPSAFTLKTGEAHWATLLRGIAITYQVFVVASAQAYVCFILRHLGRLLIQSLSLTVCRGAHTPTRSSWGETLIFSPWGTQLGRLPSIKDVEEDERSPMKAEWVVVDLDLGEVDEVRGMIPLEGQRRTDVYKGVEEVRPGVFVLSEGTHSRAND